MVDTEKYTSGRLSKLLFWFNEWRSIKENIIGAQIIIGLITLLVYVFSPLSIYCFTPIILGEVIFLIVCMINYNDYIECKYENHWETFKSLER